MVLFLPRMEVVKMEDSSYQEWKSEGYKDGGWFCSYQEWKSEGYKDGGWFCSYQEWKSEGYEDGGWFCSYQEWKWWRRGGVLGRTEPGGEGGGWGEGGRWGEKGEVNWDRR
jgi:hypothetical protein